MLVETGYTLPQSWIRYKVYRWCKLWLNQRSLWRACSGLVDVKAMTGRTTRTPCAVWRIVGPHVEGRVPHDDDESVRPASYRGHCASRTCPRRRDDFLVRNTRSAESLLFLWWAEAGVRLMMEQIEKYRYIDDVTCGWGTKGTTLSEPSTDKQGMKPYWSDIGSSVNGVCQTQRQPAWRVQSRQRHTTRTVWVETK